MSIAPRGLLVLDIDGTINPFYARHILADTPEKLPGFEEFSIEDERFGKAHVFLQAAMLREGLTYLKELDIELIWGSAWNENSNLILKMLFGEDYSAWPTIIFPEEIDFSPSIESWKLATVKSFVDTRYSSSVPVIWIDDEIYSDAEGWLRSRSGHGLLLRTDRHRGVTEEHWDAILRFTHSIADGSAISWHSQAVDSGRMVLSTELENSEER